jgi:ubiquinone/menaquinone biosynthesis C-methylase UbiE
MASTDAAFAGTIPAIYDRWLVPLLFEPFADDLARRAAALEPKDVLEVAAGTGVVTVRLESALPHAKITATDLNPAMLERAAKHAPRSVVKAADAQSLPFADKSFDLVACQFGVMFYPDRPRAQHEARRVLRPGGHYIFNVWDRIGNNPVSKAISDAVAGLWPEDPPRFLERTPFGHFDTDQLASELRDAGFREVTVETLAQRNGRVGPRQAAEGLCRGSPLSAEIDAHGGEEAMERAVAAAEDALTPLVGSDGKIDAPMVAHVLSATA